MMYTDKEILEIINDTIEPNINKEIRTTKDPNIVNALLTTRISLLFNFGLFSKLVVKSPATYDETIKYNVLDSESLSFSEYMIEYDSKRFPIYVDDYGQCDCILLSTNDVREENLISFGTYNTFEIYKEDAGYMIENRMREDRLTELFGKNWRRE